jgi:type IV pilus assembly protein PilM
MATVTLYIEDAEIKLLVNKGKEVSKWASLILDPKLVRDGVIQDEKQVSLEIKELLNVTGVDAKKVNVALSGLNSIFRIITLPAAVSQSMIEEAIMNEAQRVLLYRWIRYIWHIKKSLPQRKKKDSSWWHIRATPPIRY